MGEEKLMTEADFVSALRTWASGVYFRSRAALLQTHGSGQLRRELERYVEALRRGDGYKVSFRFPRHGVFRHYGAGRGWVIVDGKPVRGQRVLSLREIAGKKMNKRAYSLLERGDSHKEVRETKVPFGGSESPSRTPLDWLDRYIVSGTGKLADTAAEYYGDVAFRNVLKEIDKAKIGK
ncbi:hypothetical protein [Paraprevotella clara]|uniref:hypothetical protein n=1 Tax=Paraprevotella clara TaxID=454154 RepID=UPI002490E1C5|nr:hypothetical protein [Paraprevotella clara]BDI76152.1 hypothetical protein PC1C4_28740 [Paraprevotella clara]